jgi:hypothetical protein
MSALLNKILLLCLALSLLGIPLFISTVSASSNAVITPISPLYGSPLLASGTSTQCLLLSITLRPNSDGLDVVRLQTFLVSNNLLSSNYITGFYGSFTKSAIQNYQCAQNIVCSGSPATTGWGIVGPRTYAALKALCRTSATISKSGFSEWPTEGPPPLMANFGYIGGSPKGTYTINFGDGGVGVMASGTACVDCVVGSAHNAVHTYTVDGTYAATLSDSSGNVLGTATITVTGLTGRNGLSTGGVTWGVAPFSVPSAYYGDQEDGHTYTIDYGDGTSEKMLFISGPGCSVCGQRDYYENHHMYNVPGIYTATLRDVLGTVIGTSTVTIKSALPG